MENTTCLMADLLQVHNEYGSESGIEQTSTLVRPQVSVCVLGTTS